MCVGGVAFKGGVGYCGWNPFKLELKLLSSRNLPILPLRFLFVFLPFFSLLERLFPMTLLMKCVTGWWRFHPTWCAMTMWRRPTILGRQMNCQRLVITSHSYLHIQIYSQMLDNRAHSPKYTALHPFWYIGCPMSNSPQE